MSHHACLLCLIISSKEIKMEFHFSIHWTKMLEVIRSYTTTRQLATCMAEFYVLMSRVYGQPLSLAKYFFSCFAYIVKRKLNEI
jgi:hypothetical protein